MNKILGLITMVFIFFSSSTVFSQDKHIGLWTGIDQGEIGYINMDTLGFAYIVLEADTMGGQSFTVEGMEMFMKYEIDYSKKLKRLDFILYLIEDNIEVGRLPGIFKFDENDNMILHINFENEERPTEFGEDNTIILNKIEPEPVKNKASN